MTETHNVTVLHPDQTPLDLGIDLPQMTASNKLPPAEAIAETTLALHKHPVFIAGSVVAARVYGNDSYGDVDVFCPTQQVLVSTVQTLLNAGYTMDERFSRTWYRWLRYGMKGWHTNSIKLESLTGTQINAVFKLTEGHATTSLSQVLESFDFGLLGVGVEVETATVRDLRPYLFPDYAISGPLPMMPNKRDNWREGFISQYNGLREAGRYAKYHGYGYDMSEVRDDLIQGYNEACKYYLPHFDPDKQLLGEIYLKLAEYIEDDNIDGLAASYSTLDFTDSLDKIMEGLE